MSRDEISLDEIRELVGDKVYDIWKWKADSKYEDDKRLGNTDLDKETYVADHMRRRYASDERRREGGVP